MKHLSLGSDIDRVFLRVNISKELFEQLKREAYDRDISMTYLMQEIITKHFNDGKQWFEYYGNQQHEY